MRKAVCDAKSSRSRRDSRSRAAVVVAARSITDWTGSAALGTAGAGFGSSSPVVWGKRVFLTGYSGYGIDRKQPGGMAVLRQHAFCIDLDTGKLLWDILIVSSAIGPQQARGQARD